MSEKQCKELVWQKLQWRHQRCIRHAVKDGYCKQHHPEAVTARRAESERRRTEQQDKSPLSQLGKAIGRITALESALAASKAEVERLRACVRVRDGHSVGASSTAYGSAVCGYCGIGASEGPIPHKPGCPTVTHPEVPR